MTTAPSPAQIRKKLTESSRRNRPVHNSSPRSLIPGPSVHQSQPARRVAATIVGLEQSGVVRPTQLGCNEHRGTDRQINNQARKDPLILTRVRTVKNAVSLQTPFNTQSQVPEFPSTITPGQQYPIVYITAINDQDFHRSTIPAQQVDASINRRGLTGNQATNRNLFNTGLANQLRLNTPTQRPATQRLHSSRPSPTSQRNNQHHDIYHENEGGQPPKKKPKINPHHELQTSDSLHL